MKRIILLTLITVWAGLEISAQVTSHAGTANMRDSAIVYPESMTENLSDLLRSWQLDLSKAELDCKSGQNIVFNDSVYIRRLHNLPSEMELSFNSVVKNYIEMYTVRKREQVSYMLALGDYYYPMFEQALDRYGLPLELKYLPVIESALNPVAVSRAGATGLWQFMLRTGKGYGLDVNSLVDERRDPYKSTDAAARYLKDLYAIYGDWNLVIAAYNCGPGNVNKAIARSGGRRDYWEIYYFLPRETRGYVPAFIAANYVMNHYADHHICHAHSSSLTVALDTVHVNKRMHLEQVAGVLNISLEELKRLNPQYKRNIVPGDSKVHALVLPSEKMYAFIDKNNDILNYDRNRYFTHRASTEAYLDGSASLSGNVSNVYYRVKKGDNLSVIASRHGVRVSQLQSWNGLKSTKLNIGDRLIVGQKVVAAPKEEQVQLAQASMGNAGGESSTINQYYRVKKGDTLGEIAQKNGVKVTQLQSWNGLKSTKLNIGDQLIVGQEVIIAPKEEIETVDNGIEGFEVNEGVENNIDEIEPNGNNHSTTAADDKVISTYMKLQLERAEKNNARKAAEVTPESEENRESQEEHQPL